MSRLAILPAFVGNCPEIELPFRGARGWLLQAGKRQVVFVEFSETVEVPEHSHRDQWEFALGGRVEVRRLGGVEVYDAGDNFFVPAGQPHGALIHAGYRAMMIFDEPARYRVRDNQGDS